MEISHLVVNGCSFTYCQGIEDPHLNGWPALLARQLGVPVVNLGLGGSGNDAILRRTYEYFYQNKLLYPKSKPLYIIAFSDAPRREEFFKKYKGKDVAEFMTLDLQASSIDLTATLSNAGELHKAIEYSHIMNLSYEACERKKFISWNSITNLLKSNEVPYLTGDFMPTRDDQIKYYMMKNFKGLYNNALRDENYVGDLSKLTEHIKKLPCGHDPKEAMPLVSSTFKNVLTKIYSNIKPICADYLKLNQYYPAAALKHMSFNQWIN